MCATRRPPRAALTTLMSFDRFRAPQSAVARLGWTGISSARTHLASRRMRHETGGSGSRRRLQRSQREASLRGDGPMVPATLGITSNASAETIKSFTPGPGAEQPFEVPAGVTQIKVTAIGAAGAGACGLAGAPGSGAKVTATLAVTPGEKLTVDFGGGAAGEGSCTGSTAGGGASGVRSELAELVVAGGGGGAGPYGGAGGSASGTTGEAGEAAPAEPYAGGGGGGGGTSSHGGAAGSANQGAAPARKGNSVKGAPAPQARKSASANSTSVGVGVAVATTAGAGAGAQPPPTDKPVVAAARAQATSPLRPVGRASPRARATRRRW